VSENKPPSVVSVRMAFMGTLNLPTHFILTTFHIIYHLLVGQLLLFIIIDKKSMGLLVVVFHLLLFCAKLIFEMKLCGL
jgi:hypothetical protein